MLIIIKFTPEHYNINYKNCYYLKNIIMCLATKTVPVVGTHSACCHCQLSVRALSSRLNPRRLPTWARHCLGRWQLQAMDIAIKRRRTGVTPPRSNNMESLITYRAFNKLILRYYNVVILVRFNKYRF